MLLPSAMTGACYNNTFGGVPAAQAWNDFALWEEFLNRHSIRAFIELGTYAGGGAVYFGIQGRARGFTVCTIDNNPHSLRCEALLRGLGVAVMHLDLMASTAEHAIADLVRTSAHPLMLYCDNGNKPSEFRRFAPLLDVGDYIAVHDWPAEFSERDVVPMRPMVMADECEHMNSMTRFLHRHEAGLPPS